MPEQGVLVMAYGTPASLEEIEPYYTDIRHGRPPSPELLEELTARYRAIGGHSPLLEISEAQAAGITARTGLPTYLGLKHAAPRIADAVAAMARDGIQEAVGLVLAPHFSSMSIGDYERRAKRAGASAGWTGTLRMIQSWHLEPGYVDFLAGEVKTALQRLSEDAIKEAEVLFTAHSLPQKILERGDPYADQLRATGDAVAAAAGLRRWRIAWQSAGRTADPWIGPDVLEVLDDLAEEGAAGVVVCPCGFVSDHLEVLFDIDIEAAGKANDLGIELVRTASPNDDPRFLDVLASVVRRAVEAAEPARRG